MVFCIGIGDDKILNDDISRYIISKFMSKKDILNLIVSYRVSHKYSNILMEILKDDNFFIESSIRFNSMDILKSTSLFFNEQNKNEIDILLNNQSYCDRVKTLNFFNINYDFLYKFNNLTKLSVHVYKSFECFQIDSLFKILCKNTQLKYLDFSYDKKYFIEDIDYDDYFNSNIIEVLQEYHYLIYFEVKGCINLNTEKFIAFIQNNRELKTLKIEGCNISTELFNYISQLKLLNISFNTSCLNNNSLSLQESVNFLSLNMSEDQNINIVKKIIPEKVKSIKFFTPYNTYYHNLNDIFENVDNLIHLHMTISITKDHLDYIISKFIQLKSLSVCIKDLNIIISMSNIFRSCKLLNSLYIDILQPIPFSHKEYMLIYTCLKDVNCQYVNMKYFSLSHFSSYILYEKDLAKIHLQNDFLIDISKIFPNIEMLELPIIAYRNSIDFLLNNCKSLNKNFFTLHNFSKNRKNKHVYENIYYDSDGFLDPKDMKDTTII